jgi:hypothetical protein
MTNHNQSDKETTTMSRSILKEWVNHLPIRHQGVLLAAIRGCDGTPKENSAKPIVRALRYTFLVPADARELIYSSAFMSDTLSDDAVTHFLKDWDHYPVHFVQHLMHACQVVGYKHPSSQTRTVFANVYYRMVRKLHLLPEMEEDMDIRLEEDRIAAYGDANPPE